MMSVMRSGALAIFASIALTTSVSGAEPVAGQKTLSVMLPGKAASLPHGIARNDAATAFKIGRDLALLAAENELGRLTRGAGATAPSNRLLSIGSGETVLIDAVANGDGEALEAALLAIGLQRASVYGRIVSGYLPIASIAALPQLAELRSVRPSYSATAAGTVASQGDAAVAAPFARSEFSLDGSGVTVGTLSDSFDCLGGAAADVGSSDLPTGIVVIDDTGCAAADEGRAMMQIVADVAPGAAQGFHTGSLGQASFALGIEELAGCPPGSASGCTPAPGFAADVINDDVFYFDEPFFQDGIIAQAVERVVESGVAYFVHAGNHARKSYEGPFMPSGIIETFFRGELHDFDPGGGVDTMQSITVPVGASVSFAFQWDQPYFRISGGAGSASDHDIFIFDATGTTMLVYGGDFNLGGDPIEVMEFTNTGAFDYDGVPGPDTTFNVAISNYTGPDASTLKYIALVDGALGDFTVNEFDTASGTIFGHMNAAGAVTVGAARYYDSPYFGANPAIAEAFSSAGPMPVLFDAGGAPIYDDRIKPDIMAPDGVNTTFFGSDIADPGDGSDADTYPNFFGTSAAVPHAAGLAALALETTNLTPSGLKQTMRGAAWNMATPGIDDDTGFGFLTAGPLLDSTVDPGSWTGDCGIANYTLRDVPNDGPQTFRAKTSITWGDGTFDDVQGSAPRHVFTDGFESGDASSWGTCP